MPYKTFTRISFFIILLVSCHKTDKIESVSKIIPFPAEHTFSEDSFSFQQDLTIISDDFFEVSSKFLKDYFLFKNGSIKINESQQSPSIVFIRDETVEHGEGYVLDILPSEIKIKASTDKGAFYAVQTLRQLLPEEFENDYTIIDEVSIQCQSIIDAPQFNYRGMHLDVGRHMFPVEFIKKYIDALALLKMNTFHWHLTEDQGWRIEIKRYPRLQEIAAYRDETLIGHYSDQPHKFDGEHYGGYYTQEEIKEVVAYAQQRFVTIIPEIELPGHSQAAIAAYPELGCTGNAVEVATKWGVFDEIYCPKEETFRFLENVFDEVLALFPSEYIHIGGDEAPKTRWKNCESCQALIKKEELKDEHELQSYFISRIESYLNSKGRQIIGWDEILEGGLAPNATVMSWRGINGAIEAAKHGHDVVMTPTSHCYFDYYQSENDDEPLAIGGFLPLEKVYGFNPIPEELSEEEATHVLGAQGNIWTEYMPTSEQVEYMTFPRILAMSEVVWTSNKNKDFRYFIERVEKFHKRLNALGINYANHLYEIEGQVETTNNQTALSLVTGSGQKTIRYTLDNSEPTNASMEYKKPIPIANNMNVKAAVFDENSRLGTTFTQAITFHKAVGKKIKINKQAHQSYSGSGAQGLINGISGSDTRYGDKEWLGFWGEDIEISLDLGEEQFVDTIEMRFHNGRGQWIYAPKEIQIITDNNEWTYIPVGLDQLIINFDCKVASKTKSLKILVKNFGLIPEGKQGAGNKAWTFIDEIIIN